MIDLLVAASLAAMSPATPLPASGASVTADVPAAPLGRHVVERIVADNPDLLDVLLHVTPPGAPRNLVVAAHLPKDLGEVSGDDDLGVARTAKPLVEVQKDGVRIGVLLQLRDARHRAIGAVGIMMPWRDGDSQQAALARATALRDRMATMIPSRESLFS